MIAREQGFRNWQELRLAHDTAPEWVDGEDAVLCPLDGTRLCARRAVPRRRAETRLEVRRLRRWSSRELAGRPAGWHEIAERIVGEHRINVNRRGVVFVQSTESRLDPLVARVAECSVALYEELLEGELGSP